jgi:hypothetical protein
VIARHRRDRKEHALPAALIDSCIDVFSHGVEQAFMPAAQGKKMTALAAEVCPAGYTDAETSLILHF